MKSFIYCSIFLILSFACKKRAHNLSDQSLTAEKIIQERDSKMAASHFNSIKMGFDTTSILKQYTFFNHITIFIPENLNKKGNVLFDIHQFSSDNGALLFSIQKEIYNQQLVLDQKENTPSIPNGSIIYFNKIDTIENTERYILEKTGFWNNSTIKEAWTKVVLHPLDSDYQYLCFFKYPERELLSTKNYRNNIISSFRFQ